MEPLARPCISLTEPPTAAPKTRSEGSRDPALGAPGGVLGSPQVTMTDREEYHRVRKALADQAMAMLKNVPANIVLSAFADLTLQIAIELEAKGGRDSAAALKRLQEYLAQRLDAASRPPRRRAAR